MYRAAEARRQDTCVAAEESNDFLTCEVIWDLKAVSSA